MQRPVSSGSHKETFAYHYQSVFASCKPSSNASALELKAAIHNSYAIIIGVCPIANLRMWVSSLVLELARRVFRVIQVQV